MRNNSGRIWSRRPGISRRSRSPGLTPRATWLGLIRIGIRRSLRSVILCRCPMPGELRSARSLMNAGAALALACACLSAAEQPDHPLLPTAVLAREIRALQGPHDGMSIDARSLATRVANIRRDVGNFIVRQIEAYPSISECDLQKQLASAFAIDEDGCSGQSGDDGAPRVFAEPGGAASMRRLFVVSYFWFGFYG